MKQLLMIFAGIFILNWSATSQTVWTVNSTDDTNTGSGNAGTLRYVLTQINTTASGSHTVDMTGVSGTLTLTSLLPPINYSMVINGSGTENLTISGNNLYRIFFVGAGTSPFTSAAPASPTVQIKNMTLANGKGKGGNGASGGGGAAGMGGAIFQNAGVVTVENVIFSSNNATGGNGSSAGAGGGGGFGGDGQSIYSGGVSGYLGGATGTNTVLAGIGGGGGYRATFGGAGGFAAGGGPGGAVTSGGAGGAGGFGGGGGGVQNTASNTPGVGGFGGGNAGGTRGGGGAGMGGAVFLKSGTLYLKSCSFLNNSATAGTTTSPGQNGTTYGGAIFQYDGALYTLYVTYGTGGMANSATNSTDYYRYGGTYATLNPTGSLLKVTSKTTKSAVLNGKVNPNGAATSYKFIYSTEPDLLSYSETSVQSAGSGTTDVTVSAAISGLTPKTKYYYKLFSENSSGSHSTEIKSFTTVAAVDGLVLWLRADSLITKDGSNSVSEWGDLSDQENNFVQSTSSKRPLWVSSVVNSKPALRFDGSDDIMSSVKSLNLTAGSSIFIVAKNRVRKSNNGLFRVAAAEIGVASDLELFWEAGTIPSTGGNFVATSNRPATGNTGLTFKIDNDAGPISGTYYMVSNHYISNGNHAYYMNSKGMELNYGSAQTMQLPLGTNTAFIGLGINTASGSSVNYLDGDIAEIMVFDRAVMNSERILIESRLAARYGIANSTAQNPTVPANAAGTGTYVLGSTGAVLNITGPSTTAGSLTAVTGTNPGATGILPNGVTAFSSDKYWSVTQSGLTSFVYSITLDLTGISGITDFESLKILKRADASSQWQDVSQAPVNATVLYHEPFITVSGLTSFSDFAVGSNNENTLPVELTDFSVRISNGQVVLNWSTASETNNYGWEIQRQEGVTLSANEGSASTNPNHDTSTSLSDRPSGASGFGTEWETIGFVAGKGTTTKAQTYSHSSPVTGHPTRFRLKQTDLDGTFTYSRILSIEPVPQNFELSGNYPNPFNPSTTIRFSIPEKGTVTLRVYSVLGQLVETRIVANLEAGVQLVPFSGSGLASGQYFYQLQFKNKVLNGNMTLLK